LEIRGNNKIVMLEVEIKVQLKNFEVEKLHKKI